MFSVAFFSLASLALSALASPLALNGLPNVPDTVDKNVKGGAKVAHHKAHDTVSDVPHVRRHDPESCLTAFLQDFEAPLANVESIVNGATDATALAAAIKPALYRLMTPMTNFVGNLVADIVSESGVVVQDDAVTIDSQQTVLTVTSYTTRLTTCLSKASDMVRGEPETVFAIKAAATMFTTVVNSIGFVSGIANLALGPVYKVLVPLVSKLGGCTTSSLGL